MYIYIYNAMYDEKGICKASTEWREGRREQDWNPAGVKRGGVGVSGVKL